MRRPTSIFFLCVSSAGAACGNFSEQEGLFPSRGAETSAGGPGARPLFGDGTAASDSLFGNGEVLDAPPEFSNVRIEPNDAILAVGAGLPGQQSFRVMGTDANGVEADITERFRFWVAEGFELGSFPSSLATFQARATQPLGGLLEVNAVGFIDDEAATLTARLTLRVRAKRVDPRLSDASALNAPENIDDLFQGAVEMPAEPAEAPRIVYPNDGTLLPPNLRRLDVHWLPGSDTQDLFELRFESDTVDLRYLSRCGPSLEEGCGFELDEEGYTLLAESSRGLGPVQLSVVGLATDGQSLRGGAPFSLEFSREEVAGAVYYWTTSNGSSIVRFDFGQARTEPEAFIQTGQGALPDGACIGCHALSRDGTKLVASLNGRGNGQQVFVNDLTVPQQAADFFALSGDEDNRLQFASFNPDGSRFVAVWGDHSFNEFEGDQGDPSLDHVLWMHDGNTGQRLDAESIFLDFEPSHPAWSPDGSMIAFTQTADEAGNGDPDVSGSDRSSQRPFRGGISVVRSQGTGFGEPEVLIESVPGLNQFNPSFAPDSSFYVFTVSTCDDPESLGAECDGDDDPTATTWASAPTAGATPLHLRRAAAGGVMDGDRTALADTFPRSSPFASSYSRGQVFWVTVSSRRRTGLGNAQALQQLWMFALDTDAVLAGKDGSFSPFFLPFQERSTNNHLAQWTERIVDGSPPPPRPSPPEPPPVPEPPPPVVR